MTRVILTLLLFCQPFYLGAAEIGFTEPGLLSTAEAGQPRVVIVHDAAATQAFAPQTEVVQRMVARGIVAFTGRATPAEAWRSLINPEDLVGIKVHSGPGRDSGTRPAVAAAVVKGLLEAGHAGSRIILWDRRLEDLRAAGYSELASSLGIRLAGALDSGWDRAVAYENPLLGQLVYGDLEFRRTSTNADPAQITGGRSSYLSRLLTQEITRIINIAPLLNHNHLGTAGLLYTMASASTDNFLRFETHPSLLVTAVPEIYGLTNVADRVVLNLVDALVAQYEGGQRSLLHRASALNELRFGTDPVMLDALSFEELNSLRATAGVPVVTNRTELLQNAQLMELGSPDTRRVNILRLE